MNGTQAADGTQAAGSTQPTDGTAASTATDEDGSGSTREGIEAAARERVDELDERLIALVQERRSLSARIQQARIESGGRRVHLAGKMQVLDHYRRELGRPGTQLAMLLLAFCRGQS